MPNSEHRIYPRRLRAVAILDPRYGTVDALYKRLSLCTRATTKHVATGTLPPKLAQDLARELGPEVWEFVIGRTNVLTDLADLREAA